MNEQLLKQLGVEQQILQQMVDERASLAEANRLKIRVGDEEVRQRILSIPALSRERAIHRRAAIHAAVALSAPADDRRSEFEENLRRTLIVDKLRASLTDWMSLTDKEVEQEYRRRNDEGEAGHREHHCRRVSVTGDGGGRRAVRPISTHTRPTSRFLRRDASAICWSTSMRSGPKPSCRPPTSSEAYNANIEQYSTPEQIRASHILLKTEGKDDAAVKARAEDTAQAGASRRRFRRPREEELRG